MSGELPTGWACVVAADVVEHDAPILYGILQPGPEQADGVPYVRPTEIDSEGSIDLGEVRRTTPEIARQYSRSVLAPNDVLLSIVGTIGKVAVVPEELRGANITQSSVRFRPAAGLCDGGYLAHLLRSPVVRSQFDKLRLGTGVPRLNVGQVRELALPLPPLPEQRRIVAKLDDLRARSRKAREALDEVPALLDKLKQSVLAAAFRGDLTAEWRAAHPDVEPASVLLERIRVERRKRWEEANPRKKYVEPEPVDAEGLPELPEGWCWATIDDLVEDGRPICYGVLKAGPEVEDGVPLIRVTDIVARNLSLARLKRCSPEREQVFARARLRSGDLVVTKDGTIGQVAIVPPELDGANITQHVLRVSVDRRIDAELVMFGLLTPLAQAWMKGEARGVALQGVNVGDFRRLPIPVPPRPEGVRLVEDVRLAMAGLATLVEVTEQLPRQLANLDQSILAKAFRGELVPQDPTDEPADVLLARIKSEAGPTEPKRGRGRPPKQVDR